MVDLKTTISGLIASIGATIKLVGFDLPPAVADSLIAIGVLLMGYFAKDSSTK